MGKPGTAEEAGEMLAALSGRTHQVVSGVALGRVAPDGSLRRPEQVRVASALTDVTFAELDEAQIQAYLATGEWKGKAGAYAIQGLAALCGQRFARRVQQRGGTAPASAGLSIPRMGLRSGAARVAATRVGQARSARAAPQ